MRIAISLVLLLTPTLVGCFASRLLAPGVPDRQDAAAARRFRDPLTAGQLVFHADFFLPPGHRMVAELTSERQFICDRLGVPAGNEPIHVYLFGNEGDYREYVGREFPGFPERRAIFVETDVRLTVYAHWSDHVAEDLRHEVAHGYLHSAVPNLPLWLDEGLAEYFEVGRGRQGLNRTHVDYLRAQQTTATWAPNLPRLEQLTAASNMTQLDYAESWLWVHYMLDTPERSAALSEYLATLRKGEPVDSLSATLARRLSGAGTANAELLGHLQSLAP